MTTQSCIQNILEAFGYSDEGLEPVSGFNAIWGFVKSLSDAQ